MRWLRKIDTCSILLGPPASGRYVAVLRTQHVDSTLRVAVCTATLPWKVYLANRTCRLQRTLEAVASGLTLSSTGPLGCLSRGHLG